MHRPQGCVDWVFILFVTAARCRERRVPAGYALLFAPGMVQDYGACRPSFSNHWFHADGKRLAPLVTSLAIPLGELFPFADPTAVSRCLHDLERERLRQEAGWQVITAAAVITILVMAGRASQHDQCQRTADDGPLRDVRAEVHARPAEAWPVSRMAKRAGLSPSRFSARYRSAFGISPAADLIQARIAVARRLIEGGRTVAQAAEHSGFTDLPYFYRQFQRQVGCAPGGCRER